MNLLVTTSYPVPFRNEPMLATLYFKIPLQNAKRNNKATKELRKKNLLQINAIESCPLP